MKRRVYKYSESTEFGIWKFTLYQTYSYKNKRHHSSGGTWTQIL